MYAAPRIRGETKNRVAIELITEKGPWIVTPC